MVRDGAYVLDLPQIPEVFVTQNPIVNAMALGADQPFIVINTGLVDLLDAEELRSVVGHELGHVLSGHAVYRTMLFHLINLAARVAWVPLGYVGLRGIIWALEEWYRKSELSCDRAGLLASQDPAAAKRVLMKLAGGSRLSELNSDAFMEQAHDYDAVPDVRDGLLKLLQLQGNSHPFAVTRFAELSRWIDSGEYDRILAGDYPRRDTDSTTTIGEEVRNAAKSYQESWNRTEDPLVGMFRGAADSAMRASEGLFGRFGGRGGNSNDDN
jgi:Zn-dependent protease with chaperone function